MAHAFVRSNGTGSGTTSPVAVTVTAPTAGNMCFAFIAVASSGANRTITTITQTNTIWSYVGSNNNGLQSVEIWMGIPAASAGTSVSIATSGTIAGLAASIAEYSGRPIAIAFTGGLTGSSVTPSTGGYTVNGNNDIGLVAASYANGTTPSASPSGMTGANTFAASGTTCGVASSYELDVASGSKSAATWTITSAVWVTLVVDLVSRPGFPLMGVGA